MVEESRIDRIEALVFEIAKQNIALGQRIDSLGQRMEQQNSQFNQRLEQQNSQLNQRIDGLAQQNFILGQRMDTMATRMDATFHQTQQQQLEIAKMFYEIKDCLEKLPEALKGQIGFKK